MADPRYIKTRPLAAWPIGAAMLAHLRADPRCGEALGLARNTSPAIDFDDEASVARAAAQPPWQDPGSGYVRRNVSPAGWPAPFQIVDVHFPPRARVAKWQTLGT